MDVPEADERQRRLEERKKLLREQQEINRQLLKLMDEEEQVASQTSQQLHQSLNTPSNEHHLREIQPHNQTPIKQEPHEVIAPARYHEVIEIDDDSDVESEPYVDVVRKVDDVSSGTATNYPPPLPLPLQMTSQASNSNVPHGLPVTDLGLSRPQSNGTQPPSDLQFRIPPLSSQNVASASFDTHTMTRRPSTTRRSKSEGLGVGTATALCARRKRTFDPSSEPNAGLLSNQKSQPSRKKSRSKKRRRVALGDLELAGEAQAPYVDPEYPRVSADERYAHIVQIGYQVIELHCSFCKGNHYKKHRREGDHEWALSGILGIQKHIQLSHGAHRDKAWIAKHCVRKVLTDGEEMAVQAGTYEPQRIMGRAFLVNSRSEAAEEETLWT